MSNNKFYVCKACGNLIGILKDSGVPIICCGEQMNELTANTTDASREKHLPVITVTNNKVTVTVGSALHPMTQEHQIDWIYLLTEHGGQRKVLKPGSAPEVSFLLVDDTPVAVYAYCNLHGLWMTTLSSIA